MKEMIQNWVKTKMKMKTKRQTTFRFSVNESCQRKKSTCQRLTALLTTWLTALLTLNQLYYIKIGELSTMSTKKSYKNIKCHLAYLTRVIAYAKRIFI